MKLEQLILLLLHESQQNKSGKEMWLLSSCPSPVHVETKAEAKPLGPARGSVTFANGPLSPRVQQGTGTWYHFYEMWCFSDSKCLSAAGKNLPTQPRHLQAEEQS